MEEAQRESERERENRLCFGQALMDETRENQRRERKEERERRVSFSLPKKLVSPLSIIIHYRFAHLRIYKSGERERRSEKQSLRFEQRTTQLLLIGLYIYTH